MKKYYLIWVMCLVYSFSHAQITGVASKPPYDFDKQPIIFETNGKNKAILEKVVAEYWKMGGKSEIKTYEEIKNSIGEEQKFVAVAQFLEKENSTHYKGDVGGGLSANIGLYKTFRIILVSYKLGITRQVVQISIPNIDVNEAIATYCIKASQFIIKNEKEVRSNNMEKFSSKVNGSRIKTHTLLIDEGRLSKMDVDEVTKAYPFKYKIVSRDEIYNAILEGRKDCLILWDGILAVRTSVLMSQLFRSEALYDPADGAFAGLDLTPETIFTLKQEHVPIRPKILRQLYKRAKVKP